MKKLLFLLMFAATIEITNAKRIIATRNRIIHSYDNVSDDIIWAIIVKELSELEKEIEWLLKNA